jgi:uncharacterized protein YprB with RNaseH-like and TPR domain
MSSPFKDRLSRLHGARKRASERDEQQKGDRGVFSADEIAEYDEPPDERPPYDGPAEQPEPAQADEGADREPSDSDSTRFQTIDTPDGPAPYVEGQHPRTFKHGGLTLADVESDAAGESVVDWVDLPEFDPESVVFLDTETTGLAKTDFAFCIGVGDWGNDGLRVRHYIARTPDEESAILRATAEFLAGATLLCTFNGGSFDVPLLERRHAEHGLPSPYADLTHLDLLPVARRCHPDFDSHSLGHLEERVLDFERHDDLPGAKVPRRYSQYRQNGRWGTLEPIVDHNRLDIVSLCALIPALGDDAALENSDPSPEQDSSDETPFWDRSSSSNSRRAEKTEEREETDAEPPKGAIAEQLSRSYRSRDRSRSRTESTENVSRETEGRSNRPSNASGSSKAARRLSLGGPTDRDDSSVCDAEDVPASDHPTDDRPGNRAARLRKEADRLWQNEQWEEVLPILHRIVALVPRHTYALEKLVEIHRQRGEDRLASHYRTRLRDATPF